MINIEVIYATEQYVDIIAVSLENGATVNDAIEQSGIRQKYPDIEISEGRIGIYSKLCKPDSMLHDGDRVEIYRPLKADPREARRQRAERQKTT